MKPYDIICKKRDGMALSREEIETMVMGFAKGEIPDYQMSAFLMAVFIRGMNDEETRDLTLTMTDSGDKIDLSSIPGVKVDKHSTGGVGDTATLLIAPIVAAAGIPFAKMSGRGLGHTGGTLDKLEAIPGYRVDLDEKRFLEQVKEIGIAVISSTGDLAPADKKMYALRDVTATVDSIPLIAGSVMSKKLAAGSDAILLDVKMGAGAFMHTMEDARKLAETLVSIGRLAGKDTRAVITDMDQPLNSHIGNALEVREVFEILKGMRKVSALKDVSVILSGHLIQMAGVEEDLEKATLLAEELLDSGKALEKMRELLRAQASSDAAVDDLSLLPQAPVVKQSRSDRTGWLQSIDVLELGIIARDLGAGRIKKEDVIDPSVGIVMYKRVGDAVEKGDALADIHARDEKSAADAAERLIRSLRLSGEKTAATPLILDVIE